MPLQCLNRFVSKVPTAQLDDGFHQFNFRVLQSDGMYSPVLSKVFFKSAISWTGLTKVDKSGQLLTDEREGKEQGSDLSMIDESSLRGGLHEIDCKTT